MSLNGQIIRPLETPVFPEADASSKIYTVSGYRHGISFFQKTQNPNVAYVPGKELTFKQYHTADVMYAYMELYAKRYPDLVDVYEVARSYEGRPILQLTLTNKQTGKATDKPAAYFEGNRHSGEVTSAETVLYLMQYLLNNYSRDPAVKALLDKNAIYLRPINNPDGHNLYLHTAQRNRSTVRPYDNDGDGLLDEDAPADINGDGIIVRMRYLHKDGDYIIDPRDPSGRLMKQVGRGNGTHKIVPEGIDHDGDGRIGEDGIGGLDLHRNYPENWRPAREATDRGWTEGGAGEYPLSEPETRAVVTFLLDNPNIYIVNSMDTRVPMHLRPPSTSKSEERMYPEDLKWYQYFDKLGKSITGYKRSGDVYNDYHRGDGTPTFGHGTDFGYFYYGAIWYNDEIWDNATPKEDLNNDGKKDELDQLLWDDQYNNGNGFIEWKPFDHPQLGKVEIGGWDYKFFSQNAPAQYMEHWVRNEALFNVELLKHLPALEWDKIEVDEGTNYGNDSTDYVVRVSYKNVGKLPTALKQADLVKIVKPDRLYVQFGGTSKFKIVNSTLRKHANGKYFKNMGYAQGESVNTAEFTVRTYRKGKLKAGISISATRAGILPEKEIVIGN